MLVYNHIEVRHYKLFNMTSLVADTLVHITSFIVSQCWLFVDMQFWSLHVSLVIVIILLAMSKDTVDYYCMVNAATLTAAYCWSTLVTVGYILHKVKLDLHVRLCEDNICYR